MYSSQNTFQFVLYCRLFLVIVPCLNANPLPWFVHFIHMISILMIKSANIIALRINKCQFAHRATLISLEYRFVLC